MKPDLGVLILGLLQSSAARADQLKFFLGNALWRMCQTDRGSATLVVMGMTDAFTSIAEPENPGVPLFCVRENVNGAQVTDIVCHWLRDNPKTRESPASDLALKALGEAFPCSK
jgi:hypothetical protein